MTFIDEKEDIYTDNEIVFCIKGELFDQNDGGYFCSYWYDCVIFWFYHPDHVLRRRHIQSCIGVCYEPIRVCKKLC